MFNIGLQVLRAKIRGFHATGVTISHRISLSKKERKSHLWDKKRLLGNHCRYHLVAYGLLRGVPYHQIERCAQANQLDLVYLQQVMQAHGGTTWTLEKVKALLAPLASPPVALEKAV